MTKSEIHQRTRRLEVCAEVMQRENGGKLTSVVEIMRKGAEALDQLAGRLAILESRSSGKNERRSSDYSSILDDYEQGDFCEGPSDLHIAEDGEVTVTDRREMTGTVWQGRTLVCRLAANVDLDALRNSLGEEGRCAPLIGRVIAGHSVEWNGRQYIGVLTDDASGAWQDLVDLLHGLPQSEITVWDAAAWLYGERSTPSLVLRNNGLWVDATPERIAAVAREVVEEAVQQKVHLVGGVEAASTVFENAIESVNEETAAEAAYEA